MAVSTKEFSFPANESQTPQKLAARLGEQISTWRGKLLVLGGHYRLYYRESQQRFVPLLRSMVTNDPNADQREKEQVRDVGDFPELSFEVAILIAAAWRGGLAKVVLLVDDEQFRRFQPGPVGEDLARSRREFYCALDSIPRTYTDILQRHQLNSDIFEPNDANRAEPSTLPSRTVLYSEHVLKKQFSRHRKGWLLDQPGFHRETDLFSIRQRILWKDPVQSEACILDEEGEANCSSTTLELLLTLKARDATHLILFLPNHCRAQVDASVRAALSSFSLFESILAVWEDPDFGTVPSRVGNWTLYTPQPSVNGS